MASTAVMVSSTAAVGSTPKLNNAVPAFNGLRSAVQFPSDATALNANVEWKSRTSTNGGRVECMLVWNPYNNQKFETLSYLPPLKGEKLAREVEYLLRNGWIPCLEFDEDPYIKREYHRSPGCYNGRYWVMWKLPMFGCQDAGQVLAEIEECKKAYPKAFIRVIGFDNVRQVQCISFVVHKPF